MLYEHKNQLPSGTSINSNIAQFVLIEHMTNSKKEQKDFQIKARCAFSGESFFFEPFEFVISSILASFCLTIEREN